MLLRNFDDFTDMALYAGEHNIPIDTLTALHNAVENDAMPLDSATARVIDSIIGGNGLTTTDIVVEYDNEQYMMREIEGNGMPKTAYVFYPTDYEHASEFVHSDITNAKISYLVGLGLPLIHFTDNTANNVSESVARFSSAQWYDEVGTMQILIAGLGGIGSHAAFTLSRLHPERMGLVDMDTVEEVNMAGQLYTLDSVGKRKTDALHDVIYRFGYRHTICLNGSFPVSAQGYCPDVAVIGFDNMKSRRDAYVWYRSKCPTCLYIEARLAAEYFEVYTLYYPDNETLKKYEDTLFSDEEAEETRCSYKQTTYMASMLGSVITNIVVNHASNIAAQAPVREVPFKVKYDAFSMLMSME